VRHITTAGIILKKKFAGEQDQYITLYSPDFGKIEAIARGSRKINSSFTGHLEILNICDFELYKSSYRITITQCQLRHSFRKIREKLDRSMISFLLVEIFHKMASEGEEQSKDMFTLIKDTLTAIDEGKESGFTIEYFKIKMLRMAGALPDISVCGTCSTRWEQKIHTSPSLHGSIFANQEGHIFCNQCVTTNDAAKNLIAVPFNTMKLIHYISTTPSNKMPTIRLTPDETAHLKKITDVFLHNYLPSELKSEKILADL
jgi:DNA repair protein RecO (recombination protein O)